MRRCPCNYIRSIAAPSVTFQNASRRHRPFHKIVRSLSSKVLHEDATLTRAGSNCYSWGLGVLGGLGHGSYEHIDENDAKCLQTLVNEEIKSVACGWTTSLALTGDGRIFEWGWEKNIVSLVTTGKRFARYPSFVERLQRLRWGWMTYDCAVTVPMEITQVRQFSSEDSSQYETVAASNVTFVNIDAGSEFCVGLSDDGRVFTWGSGIRGQLGHGDTMVSSNMNIPTQVRLQKQPSSAQTASRFRPMKRAKAVSCGFQYLMVLDEDGDVWGCGKGATGCLGLLELHNATDRRQWHMANVRESNLAYFLKQRQQHSSNNVAAPSMGGVLSEMMNNANSSNGNTKNKVIVGGGDPKNSMPTVADVSAGLNHTLFLTEDGEVWATGRNNNIELGLPDFYDRWAPSKVDLRSIVDGGEASFKEGETIVQVSAGNMHSAALTNYGRVITWGMNRHGQCGVSHEKAIVNKNKDLYESLAKTACATPPTTLRIDSNTCPGVTTDKATRVFTGFYDTFVLMEDGNLVRVGAGIRGGDNMNTNEEGERQYLIAKDLKQLSEIACGWRHVLAIAN
mmetsp:Transcript_12196/g.16883  ORF Transcript_12196/g.16883 Transcript_12196/m.16883 type:complete len:565 (-) Transcript_12196:73-1767(-)